jgi:predicted nucleic acid-binding Zn ribbon protein
MPTAQCLCTACGHAFAYLTFKGDDTPPVCPRCKGRDIRRKDEQQGFMAAPGLGALISAPPKGPS